MASIQSQRSFSHRSRHRFALAAATLLIGTTLTAAQTYRTREPGIPVGRLLLYPSLTIENTQDDNVFYQSEDLPGQTVESGLWTIRPGVMFELPSAENLVRFSYAPTIRDYTSDQFVQTDHVSHFADLDTSFRIGPSARLSLRDHFGRGTIEVREVDAGGELLFSLAPFLTHSPAIDVTVNVGPRFGASLIARSTKVDYQGAAAAFYDYHERSLEGRLNYHLTPQDMGYVFYTGLDTEQVRPDLGLPIRNVSGRITGLGLRRTLNREVLAYAWVGHQALEFEGMTGSDFSGTVFEANATWQLRDVGVLATYVTRQAHQSFFVTNNNYYISSQIRIGYAHQIGRRTFIEAGGELSTSQYPDPIDAICEPGDMLCDPVYFPSHNRRREDVGYRATIGMGYAFRPTLRLILGYHFEARESNVEQCSRLATNNMSGLLECDPTANPPVFDPFDYEVHRFTIRMEMGWL